MTKNKNKTNIYIKLGRLIFCTSFICATIGATLSDLRDENMFPIFRFVGFVLSIPILYGVYKGLQKQDKKIRTLKSQLFRMSPVIIVVVFFMTSISTLAFLSFTHKLFTMLHISENTSITVTVNKKVKRERGRIIRINDLLFCRNGIKVNEFPTSETCFPYDQWKGIKEGDKLIFKGEKTIFGFTVESYGKI